MPPEPMKQLSDPMMRSRWSLARRRGTIRADDTANSRSPSPHVLPSCPVAGPAAEARRALSKDESSAARLPSQQKRARYAADVANEATEVGSARLTPELSRAEGVGLNEWLGANLAAGLAQKQPEPDEAKQR